MRVLITGGAGFIGSHLSKHHILKKDEVVVVDDLSTGTLTNLAILQKNPLFKFEHADILTWPALETYVRWADRIYHMAATVGVFEVLADPIKVLTATIQGCERLLRIIYESESKAILLIASSSSVYGESTNHSLNEHDNLVIKNSTQSLAAYTVSKLAVEELGLAYYHLKQIKMIIARLFNIIGPYQNGRYGYVVPRFIQQACHDQPITVYGSGEQSRSFCDVRDAVVALDLLTGKENAIGEIVNVGNDQEISINQLAKLIRAQTKSHSEIIHIPYQEAYGEEFTDTIHRCPDIYKLLKLTNMNHQWTLDKTIDFLISLTKHKIVSTSQ